MHVPRWAIWALLALLTETTGSLSLAPPIEAAEKPNVLFIISDDLNRSLGCYDRPEMKTPNIDKLAARGVRFANAYCQYPLCGPSRNSMLTGLHPNSTGVRGNSLIFRQFIPNQVSLPQAFRLDGYFAARIGKLYHYNVPNSIGTNGHDDPGSWELELNPAGCDRLLEQPDTFTLVRNNYGSALSWYASPRSDAEHTDGKGALDAKWVLDRCAQDRSRPFFLALGFFRPHTPYISPQAYFNLYDRSQMPVVENLKEDQADLPPDALGSHKPEHEKLTRDLTQQAVQAYYASVSFMDAQLGVVLDHLEQSGLADNTIVVFTSDHGYHLGEHGLWQKRSLFEESAGVPLIIAGPGAKAGSVVESPVGLIDLYPTLAELCGVKTPENLQGQSMKGLLQDPNADARGWCITQVGRGRGEGESFGYTIRTLDWRYTEWDEGRRGRELYDSRNDPKELTNLADVPAQADQIAQLSKQLRAAVKETYPSSGLTPVKRNQDWAPNLTNP